MHFFHGRNERACGITRSHLRSRASFLFLVHSNGLHVSSALLSEFPLQPVTNIYCVENFAPKPFRLMRFSVILSLHPQSKSKNLQFASHRWKADWHLGGSLRSSQEGWDPWNWICRPVRNYQPLQHSFLWFFKKSISNYILIFSCLFNCLWLCCSFL